MFFQFAFLSAPVPVSVLSYITTSVSYPYPEKIAVSVNIHPPMHAYPRASSCRCSESESETIFVGMFVITVISYHRQGGYKAVVICKIQNYTCNHGLIRLHFFVFCCFRSVKLRLHLTTGCTVVYNRVGLYNRCNTSTPIPQWRVRCSIVTMAVKWGVFAVQPYRWHR